ncbi:MAG: hypothetical protein ABIG44_07225 [Planctomycetota bacterium]
MSKIVLAILTLGVATLVTGCAHNSVVAHESTRVGTFFGDLGITGHNNNLTVLHGSRLNKISFIGDNNTVMIEEGVTLGQIEFWGINNTVNLPESLMVRLTEVGRDNKVIRHTSTWDPDAEHDTVYIPQTTSTPAEPRWTIEDTDTEDQPPDAWPGTTVSDKDTRGQSSNRPATTEP